MLERGAAAVVDSAAPIAAGRGVGETGESEQSFEIIACPAQVRPGWPERLAWLGSITFWLGFVALWLPSSFVWACMALIGSLMLSAALRSRKRVRCVASVRGRVLRIPDLGVVRADEVLRASMLDGPGEGATLTLVRQRGPAIVLEAQSTEDGSRLIQSLGLGVSQSRAVISGLSLPPTLSKLGLATLIPLLLFLGLALGLAQLNVSALLVAVLLVPIGKWLFDRLASVTIEVGADGICLRGASRAKFISLDELVGAMPTRAFLSQRVQLQLRNGGSVSVFMEDAKLQSELLTMIGDTLAVQRAAQERAASSALERGDRSARDWVVHLMKLGSGAQSGYRESPVHVETLLGIVSDAKERPTRRAAAAIALSSATRSDDRGPLSEAARAIAHPRLRIAVEAASDGNNEEVLAAALESVVASEAELQSDRGAKH